MPSTKIIKRRIASVNSTQQIMKAMDLVAASKLQKAKARLDVIRPLQGNIKQVMDGIQSSEGLEENAFIEKREVKSIAYIVITSDRGLCGSYNMNVSKQALALINANAGKRELIIAVGAKGWEYFKRRGKNVEHKYESAAEASFYGDAERIGKLLVSLYTSHEIDEAYIVYTHFETILSHDPCVARLLPAGAETGGDNSRNGQDRMTYDPDVNLFMSYAVPMYLNMFIYGAMVESAVCEQAARMTSMDAATRNAGEIIGDLTLEYNRKRQGLITQEITEIVSGANALQ